MKKIEILLSIIVVALMSTLSAQAQSVEQKLQEAAVTSQVAAKLLSSGHELQNYTYHYGDKVIVLKAARKFGFRAYPIVGAEMYEEAVSPFGGLGVSHSSKVGEANLRIIGGKAFYTDNAKHSGGYFTYGAEGVYLFTPFRFGKNKVNSISFGGGIGYERYHTDSKDYVSEKGEIVQLKSGGNIWYPVAEVAFTHEVYATGRSWSLGLRARTKKSVVQGDDAANDSWGGGLYFKYSFSLHKGISNLSKKEIKRLRLGF